LDDRLVISWSVSVGATPVWLKSTSFVRFQLLGSYPSAAFPIQSSSSSEHAGGGELPAAGRGLSNMNRSHFVKGGWAVKSKG